MEDFFNRLKSLRIKRESAKAFCQRIGISESTYQYWKNGEEEPSRKSLEKVCEATGVSIDWLWTGNVQLRRSDDSTEKSYKYNPYHDPSEYFGPLEGMKWDNIELAKAGHAQAVPVVGRVEAGGFQAALDGDQPAGIADEYVYTDNRGRGILALQVTNDSMAPEFNEGEIVLVNPHLDTHSGDYVIARIDDDDEATFKQLVLKTRTVKGKTEMGMILHPLNPKYADIEIADPSRIRIVGKVVEKKKLYE